MITVLHSCPSLPSQSSVPLGTPFSTMGHVGGYPRISYFPTCIWDRWDSPMESHVYHYTGQSYVSVLSHCPTWDTWDSPMESHVYHCTGQSYSMSQKKFPFLSVPLLPVSDWNGYSVPFRSRFKRQETDVPFLSLSLCKQARDVGGLYLADSVLPYSQEIATRATCISRKKRSSLQLTH